MAPHIGPSGHYVAATLESLQQQLDDRCGKLQEELRVQQQSSDERLHEMRQELRALRRQLGLAEEPPEPPARAGPSSREPCGGEKPSASIASGGADSEATCSGLLVCSDEAATDAATPGGLMDGEGSGSSLDQDYYHFSESAWSAVAFIGSPLLGRHGSAIGLCLLALTVVMQTLFCGLVISNFTEPEFSPETVDGLRAWRLSAGHSLRYMDDLSGMSLVSRVCSDSSDFHHASLGISTEQASQVDRIRKYLPEANRGSEPSAAAKISGGPVLCVFILVCYYATLVQEFQDIFRMVWGLSGVPRRKSSNVVGSEEETLRIDTIDWPRLLFLMFTLGFRAVIVCMLCYAGTLFIVNTVDMRDLLLNAVALAFVLEIDELLYSAMAPVRVRNIISRVDPLPLRRKRAKCGNELLSEFISLGTLALLGAAVLVAYFVSLRPVLAELRAAEAAICGGRQDFVFAEDGVGTLSWAPSRPARDDDGLSSTHMTRAVEEVIRVGGESSIARSRPVGGVETLRRLQAQTVADAADEGRCSQKPLDLPLQELFRELLGGRPVLSCADLEQHCDEEGIVGVRARQVCPTTCGCNTFAGRALFHRNPLLGCGRKCSETRDWVRDEPDECKNLPLSSGWRQWQRLADAVRYKIGATLSPGQRLFWQEVEQQFVGQGCGAIPFVHANYSHDLCLDANTRPALLAVCPDTCGCNLFATQGCPLVCYTNRYAAWLTNTAGTFVDTYLGRRRRSTPRTSSASAGEAIDNVTTTSPPAAHAGTTASILFVDATINMSNATGTTSTQAPTTTTSGRRRRSLWWR